MPVCQECVANLRLLARSVPYTPEGITTVAAQAFALASMSQVTTGAALQRPNLIGYSAVADGREALSMFRDLRKGIRGEELFAMLCLGLLAIDSDLASRAIPPVIPFETALIPCKTCPLAGSVIHWLRPPSLLAATRHRRWLTARSEGRRIPPDAPPEPEDYLESLSLVWNSDPRGYPIWPSARAFSAEPLLKHGSGLEFSKRGFKVGMFPLGCSSHPQFKVTDDGLYFHAVNERATVAREALIQELEEILAFSVEHSIDLVVLPELMVDSEVRARLRATLKNSRRHFPKGVVAGSFHTWKGGDLPGTSRARNETALVGVAGETLLRHEKRGRFRLPVADIERLGDWFIDPPTSYPHHEVVEHLQFAPEIEVFDTELGRIALAVCADCISPGDEGLGVRLLRARPDMLFIVSMTAETKLFFDAMEQFARRGISSFFVNASCVCVGRSGEALAAVDLGLLETEKYPPTRFRWRVGEGVAEARRFRRRENSEEWDRCEKESENPNGAWLAEIGGAPKGLVLDLGRQLD